MKKKSMLALLVVGMLLFCQAAATAQTPVELARSTAMPGLAGSRAVLTGKARSTAYDLDNYAYRLVSFNGSGALVFQEKPKGKAMKGHRFYDGDMIYVNLYYRENGYAMAYEDGEFGYVDVSYIDWNNSGKLEDAKDLSDYGYRTVVIDGKGTLVFQKVPRGMAMKGHSFRDGDRIYVNLYYLEDGYALAYEDGEFGYVDASYIDWSGRYDDDDDDDDYEDDSAYISDGAKDLDDFDYRRVVIKGSGALVFQKAPRGKVIPGYRYYDGDEIYVNLYWRKDGYAVAYEDGVYGYVDASYIRW